MFGVILRSRPLGLKRSMNLERCKFQPLGFYTNIHTYQCNHEIFNNGICIFHAPKKDKFAEEYREFDADLDKKYAIALEQYIETNKFNELDFRFFSFSSESDLSYSFDQVVNFTGAFFSSKAKFQETQFLRKVDFTDAKFLGDVDFSEAIFSEHVSFVRARFSGNVNFSFASFKDGARFGCAIPSGAPNWDSYSFEKDVFFSGARFSGDIEFLGNDTQHWKIGGGVRETQFWKDKLFGGQAIFHAVRILPGARVVFDSVDLSRASFLLTDVTSFEFKSVIWHKLGARFGLIDEIPNGDYGPRGFPVEKVAENYRQLVLNYETTRNYDLAEDFHYGEMEMRRRAFIINTRNKYLRCFREFITDFAIYRVSSLYGTSHVRALFILVTLALSFALIMMYAGFRPESQIEQIQGSSSRVEKEINYDFFPGQFIVEVGFRQWLSDFCKALLFAIATSTFQKERYFQPSGTASKFFVVVFVILIAAQAAMFLFALRRRFKR
jgi:uncharacterized protein YjbI with pentapeptide repeats